MQKEAYETFLTFPLGLTTKAIKALLENRGFTVSDRSIQRWVKALGSTTEDIEAAQVQLELSTDVRGEYQNAHASIQEMPDGVYVLTAAQADTYINENFFASLLQYCIHRGAKLLIAPMVYNVKKRTKWFDPRISEYMVTRPIRFAPDLVFGAGINVLPTSARPLAGFASYFKEGSGIIPHTKMHLESLPRYKGSDPRFLYTSGAITRRNYTDSKSGAIADFHHVFGALIVEVSNGRWFTRQLIADEGGAFFDMSVQYTPAAVLEGHRVASVTWGDLHREMMSSKMIGSMLSIQRILKPEIMICHDVLDFGARSYHTKENWDQRKRMYRNCSDNVSSMLVETGALLNLFTQDSEVIVVPSNHDKHLERWMNSAPEQFDFDNIATYHQLNYLKHTTKYKTVLEMALKELGDAYGVQFLKEDESYERYGIEHSIHGDAGPNGSRGSPNNLRGIGVKLNTGHTHSASIVDGVYTAGCMCSLDMGYNTGPSSWSHSFIVTYKNGKRSIVTMRDEEQWRIE